MKLKYVYINTSANNGNEKLWTNITATAVRLLAPWINSTWHALRQMNTLSYYWPFANITLFSSFLDLVLHLPVHHSPHLPVDHSLQLPVDHALHLPVHHSLHLPLDHSPHLPLDHSPHLPIDHAVHLPVYHSLHLPLDHSPHLPVDHKWRNRQKDGKGRRRITIQQRLWYPYRHGQ